MDDLYHQYTVRGRPVTAVDHISFEVTENQLFTLLGPSGCGKTTTLRRIAGLEEALAGTITLEDVVLVSDGRVPTYKCDIGVVFQEYALWPHMTVCDITIQVAG